jgi:hypothetical protein
MFKNAIDTSKTQPSKRRRSAKLGASVVGTILASGALLGGSAASASAAPAQTLAPWYTAVFPTWSFGGLTTFCVSNPRIPSGRTFESTS